MAWTSDQEVEWLERRAYAAVVDSRLLPNTPIPALGNDADALRAGAAYSPWVRGVRAAILDELHARALRT